MQIRHIFLGVVSTTLLVLVACVSPESVEDEPEEDELVGAASSAATTITTSRVPFADADCNALTSKVQIAFRTALNVNNVAPWKTLTIRGTFSLDSGANGVQMRYWLNGNGAHSQTDAAALGAASGEWSWTYNNLTCTNHSVTVCAVPYRNNTLCGDLSVPTSDGYRACQTMSFRGCSNAVGVIPDGYGSPVCPAGTDTLTRYMDDEDVSNNNAASGWIGNTVSGPNTSLSFCRVNGSSFYPLTCTSDSSRYYAVLKLGTVCPNGSTEFWKQIDNENSSNENDSTITSGDLVPLVFDGDTRLHFCLFQTRSSFKNLFPDIGIPYGVFATSALVGAGKASTSGWFRTDDENTFNSNLYGMPSSAPADALSHAQQIISAGGDTTFYTAKVNTSSSGIVHCPIWEQDPVY